MLSLLILVSGCTSLFLSDDWIEQRRHIIDKQMSDITGAINLKSFAFLKEDNPCLERDIYCDDLSTVGLAMILDFPLDMPCMLKPRFSTEYGTVFYNGEKLVSGASEIYCSLNQDALLRIEGASGKTEYHSLSFVPYSNLPVIEITVDGGAGLDSRNDWLDATMITRGMGQLPDSKDSVRVRYMRMSDNAPKMSFKLESLHDLPLMGMKSNRRWCFLANFEDRTQLRSSVAFEMGRLAGGLEWTPSSRYANLTVNGRYQGLYQITEQICIDEDRIDIDETDAYILNMDRSYSELWKFRSKTNRWYVNMVSPTGDDCDYSKLLYIKSFINSLEDNLESGAYGDVYDSIDVRSFVDYGLIQSLTSNNGLCDQKSVYSYKKNGGRLYAGPLWDFEYGSFNNDSLELFTEFHWYRYLKDNLEFCSQIRTRWAELKPAVESRIYACIDSLACVVAPAVHASENLYPYGMYAPSYQNDDDGLSFEDAVTRLKTFIGLRIDWMDKEINSVK